LRSSSPSAGKNLRSKSPLALGTGYSLRGRNDRKGKDKKGGTDGKKKGSYFT
jgi:hypothetical protein